MKYAIKQRVMAFGDDFDIRDENGKRAYFVDGMAFSFATTLKFKDNNKHEVARITQKLMTFAPTFKIKRRGQLIGLVRKKLFSFRPQFTIESSGQILTVIGSVFEYDYKIYRDRKQIAHVSKKLLAVRDCYGVDIENGEDEVMLLCCAIVIDMVLHGKKKKK